MFRLVSFRSAVPGKAVRRRRVLICCHFLSLLFLINLFYWDFLIIIIDVVEINSTLHPSISHTIQSSNRGICHPLTSSIQQMHSPEFFVFTRRLNDGLMDGYCCFVRIDSIWFLWIKFDCCILYKAIHTHTHSLIQSFAIRLTFIAKSQHLKLKSVGDYDENVVFFFEMLRRRGKNMKFQENFHFNFMCIVLKVFILFYLWLFEYAIFLLLLLSL